MGKVVLRGDRQPPQRADAALRVRDLAMSFAARYVVRAVGSCLIFANRFCPIDLHALPRGGGWRLFRLRKCNYWKNLVAGTKIEFLAPEVVVVGILRPFTLAHDGARRNKFVAAIRGVDE